MSSIQEILNTTQLVLSRYILPICLIMGIFGNVCNICIFIQKKLRVNACSIYFLAASSVNLLIIIFGIIPTISASYIADPSLYLTWACKLKLYGLHSLLMMSRVYIALACIDQYFFCSANPRLRQFSGRKVALIAVPIVPVAWLVIPIHMLIFVDVQIPYVKCGTSGVYSLVYSIYSFVCSSIPLILMIIFSALAFYNLRKLNQRVVPVANTQSSVATARIKKYDYQIMVMLIFEVVIYLISNVLHPTNTLYMTLTAVPKGSPPKSALRLSIEGFVTYLTWGFLIYINSCLTFYINFCVSKVFRSRFYYLCIFIFNWCKYGQRGQLQNRVHPMDVSATVKFTRAQQ
ncbi:unnamed protein product [Adineta steineri]|uniref:G-protein coupled receptors family 1 profile domain-containing protein n=1 Tax=Adineta steineri TaxID=433720 RepID=A0A813WJD3_9BILA|nr:unnamed protein product [Adineta steineri]CAF4101750.1 unnamed protein product [Adineta steineri]